MLFMTIFQSRARYFHCQDIPLLTQLRESLLAHSHRDIGMNHRAPGCAVIRPPGTCHTILHAGERGGWICTADDLVAGPGGHNSRFYFGCSAAEAALPAETIHFVRYHHAECAARGPLLPRAATDCTIAADAAVTDHAAISVLKVFLSARWGISWRIPSHWKAAFFVLNGRITVAHRFLSWHDLFYSSVYVHMFN
jgi:hypothetical protein